MKATFSRSIAGRLVLAGFGAITVAATLAACGGGPSESGASSSTSSSTSAASSTSTSGAAPSTTTGSGASNLTASPAVKAALLAAVAAMHQLQPSDYSGLAPGSTFYGIDHTTGDYWAGAAPVPSPSSQAAQVSTQDTGSYVVLTRAPGGSWHGWLTGMSQVPGSSCPVTIPADVLAVWNWAPGSCSPPSTASSPASSATTGANLRTVLSPATVPPVSDECSLALNDAANGNVTPLLCAAGGVNVLAWQHYARGSVSGSPVVPSKTMALGTGASSSQVLQAMCSDYSNVYGTKPLTVSAENLAAAYYGWNFSGTDPVTEFAASSCPSS